MHDFKKPQPSYYIRRFTIIRLNNKSSQKTNTQYMNWTSISTVMFVILLILLLVVSFTSLYLPALYQYNPIAFYIVTTSSSISVLLGCYSYFRAVITSPGYTNPSQKSHYSPSEIDDMKSRHAQQQQYKRLLKKDNVTSDIRRFIFMLTERQQIKNLSQDSYCQKCDNIKLSRSHHCSICKRCISRMDHHCPWVGNCVGKYNHKYFLLFLFYITIALLIVSLSVILDYVNPQQPVLTIINEKDELYYIVALVTGGMCVMLMFSIGFLLVSQILLVVNNLTTLESFYDGIYQISPFDKDSFPLHMNEIMGHPLWLLPTQPFPDNLSQINVAFTQQK